MTDVTCRLTAKNRDQLRSPTLGNRVRATFTFFVVTRYFRNMYYVCVDNSFVASDGGTKKSIADDGDDAAGCGGWWWWDAGDVDMTSVTPFWNELSSWLTASLHDVRDVDGSPTKPQNNDGGAAARREASPLAVRQSISQSIKTLIQVDKPQRAGPDLGRGGAGGCALVRHFQPRVRHTSISIHYRASSV